MTLDRTPPCAGPPPAAAPWDRTRGDEDARWGAVNAADPRIPALWRLRPWLVRSRRALRAAAPGTPQAARA